MHGSFSSKPSDWQAFTDEKIGLPPAGLKT
jgi:hypothetical protein